VLIRLRKAGIAESFCEFQNSNMSLIKTIQEYSHASHFSSTETGAQALLNRKELKKLRKGRKLYGKYHRTVAHVYQRQRFYKLILH
jgi:tmRNA-binding protein